MRCRHTAVGDPTEYTGCENGDVDLLTSAADLVRDLGFEVDVPVSLRSTNNLVAWLHPNPIVVKIAGDLASASRENQLAAFLGATGAPVCPHSRSESLNRSTWRTDGPRSGTTLPTKARRPRPRWRSRSPNCIVGWRTSLIAPHLLRASIGWS